MSIADFKDGLSLDNIQSLLAKTPFARHLEPEVTRCDGGFAELRVKLRPDLTQHHGFAHGAVIGCIADSACAWAAASVAGDVVTSEYKLHLLAPGVGDYLIGRGQVIQPGRRFVIARADVFAAKGDRERLVATALATVAVMG
jgi:uncharacterized protein (TIGR00369 family)